MKRKRTLLIITVFILFTVSIAGYGVYHLFFSLSNLPEGQFIKQVDSPDNHFSIRLYLVNGGATTSFAVRGELMNNKKGTTKNIYWEYRESSASVSWIDDHTVNINGKILDIHTDTYDWRRHKTK